MGNTGEEVADRIDQPRFKHLIPGIHLKSKGVLCLFRPFNSDILVVGVHI